MLTISIESSIHRTTNLLIVKTLFRVSSNNKRSQLYEKHERLIFKSGLNCDQDLKRDVFYHDKTCTK